MNVKLISEITTVGFLAAFKIVSLAANEKFERVRALEMAVSENSSEDLAKYAKAKADITVRNDVMSRETKALKEAIKEYKRTSGFDQKKSALYADATKALSDFKKSLDYDKKLSDIQKDMEDSISAFKASVNYDETVEALDREIAEATDKWAAQLKMYENVDDAIAEDAMKLKHIAEDAKNKTVTAEKERFDKKRRESIREMEEKVAKEKRRLDDKTARAVNDLEKELDETKAKLLHDIQAQRTEEEADCMLMVNDNEDLVRIQDNNDFNRSLEIAAETATDEKMAWWLKEHGWTKGSVLFVGSLPMIPVGYLLYRYGKFVFSVADKM